MMDMVAVAVVVVEPEYYADYKLEHVQAQLGQTWSSSDTATT